MSDRTEPAGDAADDDESVLDSLSEVVNVVLGDDLAPPEPEDPWERRSRTLDSWTAIILALVLFFVSVATKFRAPRIPAMLTVVALGLLVVAIVRLLTPPQNL